MRTHHYLRPFATVGLLAMVVAACATSTTGEPSAAASATPVPSSAAPSATATPSFEPFDHGEIPDEIVGSYSFEVFDKPSLIDLEPDGTYVLMSPGAFGGENTVEVTGEYGIFGDEMRFGNEVAANGQACRGDRGLQLVARWGDSHPHPRGGRVFGGHQSHGGMAVGVDPHRLTASRMHVTPDERMTCRIEGAVPMTATTTTTPGRVEFLNPDGLVRNPAFTNVAVVSGAVKTVYIGGQDAITADGEIVGQGDLAAQTVQVLRNLETALKAAGAGIEHLVKLNILVLEGQDFRAGYGAFQETWGDLPNPPLVTGAMVSALAHPDFLVEIEAIAVVPEP